MNDDAQESQQRQRGHVKPEPGDVASLRRSPDELTRYGRLLTT